MSDRAAWVRETCPVWAQQRQRLRRRLPRYAHDLRQRERTRHRQARPRGIKPSETSIGSFAVAIRGEVIKIRLKEWKTLANLRNLKSRSGLPRWLHNRGFARAEVNREIGRGFDRATPWVKGVSVSGRRTRTILPPMSILISGKQGVSS